MKKQEKKWETPKLVCLYRGRPEEAVLTGCKLGPEQMGPGAGQYCQSGPGPKCDKTSGT